MARSPTPPRRPRRSARPLYAAELFSGLGDGVFWVGMIAAIAGAARFEWLLAGAVIARLAPRAVLSIPAGAIIDRSNVRTLLVQCDLARAAIMLGVAVALEGGLQPAIALLFVFVSYVIGVPTRPGIAAWLPFVVPERDLAHANAMISTIRQVMTFVGPLVGVFVTMWSVPAAFAVNGLSFAISALAISTVRSTGWATRPQLHGSGTTAGNGPGRIEHLAAIDGMSILLALTSVMYFVRGAEMVLHVLVVRDLLDAPATAIGYIGGGVGIGAVLATPFARRAAARDRAVTAITISLALTAIPTAALVFADRVSAATLLVAPVGAGMVLFEVISVITIQRTAPAPMLGRAFGALNAASNASKLVGAIVTPVLAAQLSTSAALLLVAAVVGVTIAIAFVPLARLSDQAEAKRRAVQPVADELATLPLFEGASRFALERMAGQLTTEQYEPDAAVVREGDPADDLYVVRSGEFDVFVDGRRVNGVGPGEWFGEIGLVQALPRTATVVTTAPATVWRIPGDVFLGVVSGLDDTSALDASVTYRLSTGRSSRASRGS